MTLLDLLLLLLSMGFRCDGFLSSYNETTADVVEFGPFSWPLTLAVICFVVGELLDWAEYIAQAAA